MTVATTAKPAAASAEVTRAWERYLGDIRGIEAARYDEVEAWSWAKLQQALSEIKVRV